MFKDALLSELRNFENELLTIEQNLNSTIELPSMTTYLYKWKLNHINTKISTKKESISEVENYYRTKMFIVVLFISLIIIGGGIYSLVTNSYFILFLTILIGFVSTIITTFVIKNKLKKLPLEYLYQYFETLKGNIEKIEKLLDVKKTHIPKKEKNIPEDLIMQIFDQASEDLQSMINTKNVNLNYKDRDYRRFIINLYDLKFNEKELNNFYRQIIKIILEDDLKLQNS